MATGLKHAAFQVRYGIAAVVAVAGLFVLGAFVSPNLTFRISYAVSFVVLAAIGLAIIFRIMGVINLAHGEFILVGAYVTTFAVTAGGFPLPVAMLAGALVTAVFGLVVERVIIIGVRPQLDRPADRRSRPDQTVLRPAGRLDGGDVRAEPDHGPGRPHPLSGTRSTRSASRSGALPAIRTTGSRWSVSPPAC